MVNDIGASVSGEGRDAGPAQKVVDEIKAKGGTAVVPGTTLLSTGEQLVWTPAANANGSALNAFTIVAWDGALASGTAIQVKVAVAAVNDAPVAVNDTVAVSEDTATSGLGATLASGLASSYLPGRDGLRGQRNLPDAAGRRRPGRSPGRVLPLRRLQPVERS